MKSSIRTILVVLQSKDGALRTLSSTSCAARGVTQKLSETAAQAERQNTTNWVIEESLNSQNQCLRCRDWGERHSSKRGKGAMTHQSAFLEQRCVNVASHESGPLDPRIPLLHRAHKKSSRTALKRCGFSRLVACDAPGMTASCALGSVRQSSSIWLQR